MKTQQYHTGDYVVGWFNNIVKLGKQITLSSGEEGFETDYKIGATVQNISFDSIERMCTEEEIEKYKAKYENKY